MVSKVLMTTDVVGGVWTYSTDLARWLGRRGVDVLLAAIGTPSEPQVQQASTIPNVQLRWADYKHEWMPDSRRDTEAAGEWLLDLEREFGPDAIHLNQFSFGSVSFHAPKLVVAHSCVLSWWRAVRGGNVPGQEWAFYAENVARGLNSADLIIAPSRWMMGQVQVLYGPQTPGQVIPNAREVEFFAPGKKSACVFSAGRFWDEAKNVKALDQAAAKCLWLVCVAGDGGDTQLAKSLGFLSTEEIQAWLSDSAIYALPALYEPFGLSVLEAAMSGCALVLGDIPSLRENWDGAALFVPPNDPDAIASAINSLAANPPLLAEAGSMALARSKKFSQHATTEAYLTAYRELVGSRSSRAYAS